MAKRLKLFGITYLVGKISRSNFFFQGPLAENISLQNNRHRLCDFLVVFSTFSMKKEDVLFFAPLQTFPSSGAVFFSQPLPSMFGFIRCFSKQQQKHHEKHTMEINKTKYHKNHWTLQTRGVWMCFSQGSGISSPPVT